MTNNFPKVFKFIDLHLTVAIKAAKLALKGLSGIYAIVHIPSGCAYIGSSIDLPSRLADHLVDGNTNAHLLLAIAMHGLEKYSFEVVELYEVDPEVPLEITRADLLAMEQVHLNRLFSLQICGSELRYNFNPTAGSSLGYKHTEDARAQLSDANKGAKNPMYMKSHTPETRA